MFEALFSERGLSLDRLKVLIEVRDAGSIAAAAPGDPVRQSQYSRQLRELAEYFGSEVTERRGRQLKLTDKGERLAELAREHLRALDEFRAECRGETAVFSIGAGDSLIQWLVIPRLAQVLPQFPGIRFATSNLRTNEIVRQLADNRIDFGIIRKNAIATGLKSAPLGPVTYAAVVPEALSRNKRLTLRQALADLPLATQTTDGQFAEGLRDLARALEVPLAPALACQSFPQTMAAVRTGKFWAIVPELALRELPAGLVHRINDDALGALTREAMLAWSPRLARVRTGAARVAAALQSVLKLG